MEPWGFPTLHFECHDDGETGDGGSIHPRIASLSCVCDHSPLAPGLELWFGLGWFIGWMDVPSLSLPPRYGSAFLGSESRIAVPARDYSPARVSLADLIVVIIAESYYYY